MASSLPPLHLAHVPADLVPSKERDKVGLLDAEKSAAPNVREDARRDPFLHESA
jgi:hypothetical protein